MQSLVSLLVVAAALASLLSPARAAVSVSPARQGDQCEFPDGAVGRCEKMVNCLRDKGVVRRNDTIVLCNNGNSLDMVSCCRRPHAVSKEMCLTWARYWQMGTTENNHTCTSTVPLIHGGEEAVLGEFPNMVALRNSTPDTWFCGGSLITPSFVLTAAHCVISVLPLNPDLVVALGEHDLTYSVESTVLRLDEGLPDWLGSATEPGDRGDQSPVEQIIKVERVYSHPHYRYPLKYHDIALLRLQHSAVLTSRVLPACLPMRDTDGFTDTSIFTAAGWGNHQFGRPLIERDGSTQKLRKVNIGYVEAIKCSHDIVALNSNPFLPLGLTTDMICAGGQMKDTCRGDSGCPLMQKADLPSVASPCQPEMVAGVVSWGPVECQSLGVYTRVSSYLDWITGIVVPRLLPEQA